MTRIVDPKTGELSQDVDALDLLLNPEGPEAAKQLTELLDQHAYNKRLAEIRSDRDKHFDPDGKDHKEKSRLLGEVEALVFLNTAALKEMSGKALMFQVQRMARTQYFRYTTEYSQLTEHLQDLCGNFEEGDSTLSDARAILDTAKFMLVTNTPGMENLWRKGKVYNTRLAAQHLRNIFEDARNDGESDEEPDQKELRAKDEKLKAQVKEIVSDVQNLDKAEMTEKYGGQFAKSRAPQMAPIEGVMRVTDAGTVYTLMGDDAAKRAFIEGALKGKVDWHLTRSKKAKRPVKRR